MADMKIKLSFTETAKNRVRTSVGMESKETGSSVLDILSLKC